VHAAAVTAAAAAGPVTSTTSAAPNASDANPKKKEKSGKIRRCAMQQCAAATVGQCGECEGHYCAAHSLLCIGECAESFCDDCASACKLRDEGLSLCGPTYAKCVVQCEECDRQVCWQCLSVEDKCNYCAYEAPYH
jgi:hypothetical protein